MEEIEDGVNITDDCLVVVLDQEGNLSLVYPTGEVTEAQQILAEEIKFCFMVPPLEELH